MCAAALLRFFPLWFGLPYLHARPDEGAAIGHAMGVLSGDPNPHFFHWPSLTFYLLAAVLGIASAVKSVVGDATLTAAEQILIGRAVVAAAGTLTVWMVFRVGRRVGGEAVGLIAAALLAVALLHVRDSHFAMTDVLMTTFFTASVGLLLRALDTAVAEGGARVRLRGFAVAGVMAGLAASTKYSAAAVLAAMGAAQICLWIEFRQRPWQPRAWAPTVVFTAATIAAFLAATPYSVLDFETFSRDLIFDFTHLSGGHGIVLGRGWLYHLTHSLPYGAGVLTFIAALPGFVLMARQSPRHGFVLGLLAVLFYASIGSGYTVFFRYVLPLVPIVCVMAAVTIVHLSAWLAVRVSASAGKTTAIVAGIVVAPALVHAVWFDVLLARTDSRVIAAEWLGPRIEAGQTLYDSGGDYATLDLGNRPYHVWRFDAKAGAFENANGRVPDWLVLHQSPLRTYGRHDHALRRIADERYDLVFEVRATRGAASRAIYDLQDAFFLPFSRYDTVVRPGPSILIYRLRRP